MIRSVREALILFGRNMRKTIRVPLLLFFSLMQPLIWLLLFTQIFKRLGESPDFQRLGFDSYLMFFAPTVLVMTILTASFQSGMGMVTDLDSGMLDKFLISPIRRSSVLIGKVMADGARMLMQGTLIVLVALALGARIKTGVPGALLMLVIAALFGIAWAGLSNIVALRTRHPELTMMVGILLTFPLIFMSSSMMPPGLLPSWLHTVGDYNPVTYVIDAARGLMNFGYDWGQIGKTLAVIAGVGLVTMTGATRAFRRATA